MRFFVASVSATARTSAIGIGTPPRFLLSSAASMKAIELDGFFGETGGLPVRKNLQISTTSGS